MDFWDLTKLLARRWLIAVPMLALSAVLTVLTVGSVQPDYVATAYVQLVAPVEGAIKPGEAGPAQRNPWLGQGLQTVGNAAIITVLDKTVVDELANAGLSDSYTVEMGATSPMVSFEIVGDSERQARQTAERLVELYTQSLEKLQADYGVTAKDAIKTRRLDLGTNIVESDSKLKRALVAVAGAGVLMTIAVTVGVDALLRRRRRRKAAEPPPTPTSVQAGRPGPLAAEAVRTPTSGASAPAEAGQTMRIFKAKAGGSPSATAAGATAAPVVVDYQSPEGMSPPTEHADKDRSAAGSALEYTADATVVFQRPRLPKPDWPVRNGDKKHP